MNNTIQRNACQESIWFLHHILMRVLLGKVFLFVGSHLSSLGIYCVCAAELLAAPLCVMYLCSMPVYSVTKSCPTLCNPVDCSLPGSSVRGIFQVRILQWVAISFSRGRSWLREWTHVPYIDKQGARFFSVCVCVCVCVCIKLIPKSLVTFQITYLAATSTTTWVKLLQSNKIIL